MNDISLINDGWTSWIVCSFPKEEMRFEVGPFGPEEEIERRHLLPDGEWSEWQPV